MSDPVLLTPPLSDSELPLVDEVRVDAKPGCDAARTAVFERRMGDTELSYFLPSRESGVNDMYLHLGFRAPHRLVKRTRVNTVWAILRLRHPLLSASVDMHDYNDVRFVYAAPKSPDALLQDADANLEYRSQPKEALIDTYLNGPRTLSNSRLSYLVVSHAEDTGMPTPPPTPLPDAAAGQLSAMQDTEPQDPEHDLLICAMHFIGDGMALHTFANEFFGLLGSAADDAALRAVLEDEWQARWGCATHEASVLPRALEDQMPVQWSRLRSVAAGIDFKISQQKLVGGQVFPRRRCPERRTVVPTLAFSQERTRAMLKTCKAHGVSLSAALFAICNIAWARMGGGAKELPMLMYSALNLRSYFTVPRPSPWDSYWFIAIGYFNVVLPSFLPQDKEAVAATFWHRARQAKTQSIQAAKHPLLVSRTREMATERGARSRAFAKEDDEKARGTWTPPTPVALPATDSVLPARAKVSSAALMGLSMLGNLDGMYKHAAFPSIKLHTLTTGSRQRHGAMLLFGYTFAGKLWLSLGYDVNGFEDGVVDKFWTEAVAAVEEFVG